MFDASPIQKCDRSSLEYCTPHEVNVSSSEDDLTDFYFLNQILPWVCFKRGVAYQKEDARGTSQECPDCGAAVSKVLKDRWHECQNCGSSKPRDVASAQVIRNRAVGRTVLQNACGDGLVGVGSNTDLAKSR